MKNLLTAIILSAFSPLLAQYSDSIHYFTGYTSTGTYNKTNDKSAYVFNNMLTLGLRKKNIELNSANKWLYGTQDKSLTNNDLSSAWDIDLFKNISHLYYWGLLNYNANYSLKINNQLQSGIGIAYNLVDKPPSEFSISDGVLYEYNDVILQDSTRQIYSNIRNSLRVQLKLNLTGIVSFNGNILLQNSLTTHNDYMVKSDAGLAFKLRKWLNLTTALSYNKISLTKRENFFVTYGLTIERYF